MPRPHIENFIPRKRLGQNFLVNPRVIQRIIEHCALTRDDQILEIGPGQGALTGVLATRVHKVIAVEKDARLIKPLIEQLQNANVEILQNDILTFPFASLPHGMKVIGNLPYNQATPIIEKVLNYRGQFTDFFVTVQREYAQRIVAKPNSRAYGALSCFIQYYAAPRILFHIDRCAFHPAPKVQSSFMRVELQACHIPKARDEQLLFKLIRTSFNQRRKTIANSLSSWLGKEAALRILTASGVNPKWRAENIALEAYVSLANALSKEGTA